MRYKEIKGKILRRALEFGLLEHLSIKDLNEQTFQLTLEILRELRKINPNPFTWQRLVRTWIVLHYLATPPA